jgi:restriction system protein
MADFNPVYQPVLNTSAQPSHAEFRAGIANEWSRDGEMHSVARRSAIPGQMVAGAYDRAGFDKVISTPCSGDCGRDVIAIKYVLVTVRVIDQVNVPPGPFGNSRRRADVPALLGVLDADGASKGFLTATSDFAPKLAEDRLLKKYLGSQLELVNGTKLLNRLKDLSRL